MPRSPRSTVPAPRRSRRPSRSMVVSLAPPPFSPLLVYWSRWPPRRCPPRGQAWRRFPSAVCLWEPRRPARSRASQGEADGRTAVGRRRDRAGARWPGEWKGHVDGGGRAAVKGLGAGVQSRVPCSVKAQPGVFGLYESRGRSCSFPRPFRNQGLERLRRDLYARCRQVDRPRCRAVGESVDGPMKRVSCHNDGGAGESQGPMQGSRARSGGPWTATHDGTVTFRLPRGKLRRGWWHGIDGEGTGWGA